MGQLDLDSISQESVELNGDGEYFNVDDDGGILGGSGDEGSNPAPVVAAAPPSSSWTDVLKTGLEVASQNKDLIASGINALKNKNKGSSPSPDKKDDKGKTKIVIVPNAKKSGFPVWGYAAIGGGVLVLLVTIILVTRNNS